MVIPKTALFFTFFLSSLEAFGQVNPVFKSLRFEDDFKKFQESKPISSYEQLKYINFGEKSKGWMSVGGEFRFQYQFFTNELWGVLEDDPDGFILFRNLVHFNISNGKNLRFFGQIKNNTIQSRIHPIRSIDQNILGLHQFFAEWDTQILGIPTFVRVGRQEASLGAQRLIATREGPNNRLSFDGIRAGIRSDFLDIDLLYYHPVLETPGIFDGRFNFESRVYGFYLVRHLNPSKKGADLYFLRVENDLAVFDPERGPEKRNSVGTRIFGELNRFSGDLEFIYQWGRFNEGSISAYTISTNINYRSSIHDKRLIFGLKTEIISGNKNLDDDVLGTFNPLYPMGAYFGLAALIGPSNLIDIHPSIQFFPWKNFRLNVDYDIFWRHSTNDGIYGPNVRPIFSGVNAQERYIGSQLGMFVNYYFQPHFTITLEHTYFQSGDFLKEVSPGKNLNFTALTIQFKY
ncbi:alginate export family protein [Aquiflexum lacus]|uniref:alginate export family protein n=1 Tax=Aquiflexum lacus TaxID=2483805 RepID=UPI0018952039|nr:alginate export family protein [Aquiflexum lacus]